MSFLNKKAIKDFCKDRGKRVGKGFIHSLEYTIEHYLRAACDTHDGGKITMDETIARYVGLKVKLSLEEEDKCL